MSELFEKTLQSLDWPRIVERLASYAGSASGRERIEALRFATLHEDVQRLLDETTEVRKLLDQNLHVPIGGIREIRALLSSCMKGEILVGRELLDIANTLEACHGLRRFCAAHATSCQKLVGISCKINDLQELEHLLGHSFDASGEISVTMYPALAQLRNKIHALHSRIKDRLGALLSSDELGGIVQDQFVTMRSERYVIPLKVQARSMDIGIVHDASGSGQTVFVEPRQVIPLNNELKMLEGELRREERKILSDLTRRVALEGTRILANLAIAAELEFIYARARFSLDLGAHSPVLVRHPHIRLLNARHPILVLRGIEVTPNDLTIGLDFQALILSGPNTGGKTVALKTLGLAALMARAGLHIPADARSEVGLFQTVLTDIGDQQTVEQDLSTFSGHIVGIRKILEAVGNDGADALVLLDEIAVGTDPAQGAALARAVLEDFVSRGAKVITTTHYAELKTISVQDRRFANGRVEFDATAMRPTYRVIVGTPGRSYALDIARRLGLPGAIIQKAQTYIATGQRALEDLLGELEQAMSATRDEKVLAERARVQNESMGRKLEARLAEVEKEALGLRQKAMTKFDAEIKEAREEVSKIIKSLQKGSGVTVVNAVGGREKLGQIARRVMEQGPTPSIRPVDLLLPIDPGLVKPGVKVYVVSLQKEVIAAASPDKASKTLEIQMGSLRSRVPLSDVRQPPPAGAEKKSDASPKWNRTKETGDEGGFYSSKPLVTVDRAAGELEHAMQTSGNTLDLRGIRVDEGIGKLETFLDRNSLEGEHIIFVVHGHGTGAMRNAVRETLRTSHYVARHQSGGKYQGGDGCTVVQLK